MSSEECTAAFLPKQTLLLWLYLPNTIPGPHQLPLCHSCPILSPHTHSDPCPMPCPEPWGTMFQYALGSRSQPRLSLMLGSSLAPPNLCGAPGQSEGEVRGWRGLGKFIFQQNSLQQLLYLHLGLCIYMTPWGYIQGRGRLGRGEPRH